MAVTELKSNGNGKFSFEPWFRFLVGLVISGVFAMNAYAYYVIFPKTVENIITNDKDSRDRDGILATKITDNTISLQRIIGIERDLDEIKQLLRRSVP